MVGKVGVGFELELAAAVRRRVLASSWRSGKAGSMAGKVAARGGRRELPTVALGARRARPLPRPAVAGLLPPSRPPTALSCDESTPTEADLEEIGAAAGEN